MRQFKGTGDERRKFSGTRKGEQVQVRRWEQVGGWRASHQAQVSATAAKLVERKCLFPGVKKEREQDLDQGYRRGGWTVLHPKRTAHECV